MDEVGKDRAENRCVRLPENFRLDVLHETLKQGFDVSGFETNGFEGPVQTGSAGFGLYLRNIGLQATGEMIGEQLGVLSSQTLVLVKSLEKCKILCVEMIKWYTSSSVKEPLTGFNKTAPS